MMWYCDGHARIDRFDLRGRQSRVFEVENDELAANVRGLADLGGGFCFT
jgi:hypothetical protein